MLSELSKGAFDKIRSGEEVDQPILQFLQAHEIFAGFNNEKRYRLLMSDGVKSFSFVMLIFQLNKFITKRIMPEYSIVQIKNYTTMMTDNAGIQRQVMVILDMEVLVPGYEVGKVLGSVSFKNAGVEGAGFDPTYQTSTAPPPRPVRNQQVAPKPSSKTGKMHSIGLFVIVIVTIITLFLLH